MAMGCRKLSWLAPMACVVLAIQVPEAGAQPAPQCLEIARGSPRDTWKNVCDQEISVAYCSTGKPIFGELCGQRPGKANEYYTHMTSLKPGETSSKQKDVATAACLGRINGWALDGAFRSDLQGAYECGKKAPPAPAEASDAGCAALVRYRDGALAGDLERAFKRYHATADSLALLQSLERETDQALASQPGVQAAYKLTLVAKTTAKAIGDILKLNPANGAILAAAGATEPWAVAVLEKSRKAGVVTNLVYNHDALVEEAAKEWIAKNVGAGAALAAIYNFGSNLRQLKAADADGDDTLAALSSSVQALKHAIKKADQEMRSRGIFVDTLNREKNNIDRLCQRSSNRKE